jgi:hypothetical protein
MTKTKSTLRLAAAILVTAAVIVLSALATHAPAQNQSSLTLKSIRTDKATAFYVDTHSGHGAWFVEMVLPTGNYADTRAAHGAWFVEMVLPTSDSDLMTENLKSVAATL